jgi:hypothetical protein
MFNLFPSLSFTVTDNESIGTPFESIIMTVEVIKTSVQKQFLSTVEQEDVIIKITRIKGKYLNFAFIMLNIFMFNY